MMFIQIRRAGADDAGVDGFLAIGLQFLRKVFMKTFSTNGLFAQWTHGLFRRRSAFGQFCKKAKIKYG